MLSKTDEELGQKVDRCLSDAFIKTCIGFIQLKYLQLIYAVVGAGCGVIASFLFFKSNLNC